MAETLTLTPAAAKRVSWIAEKQSKPAILRLSVDDAVSETDGVQLVVDPVSLDLVSGSVVDFVESLGGAAFRVENPQAAAGCGCGSSFGI